VEKEVNAQMLSFSQAESYLNKSLAGENALLRLECESGVSQCWRLFDGQAYMLTRSEGKELVVCCFEGRNLKEIALLIVEAAKCSGFTSIRFHTKRPAILKLFSQKFHLVENGGAELIYRSKL